MGFHIINIENRKLKHDYVETSEELAYVEFITDDSVIYQGEEHWKPFKVSEHPAYEKFAKGWYRAGIQAQELFKSQARNMGFILEELNQDQKSFQNYTCNSDNLPIKRGDFIVRNYGNIEIDVKCRSFRTNEGDTYFDFKEEDAHKHKNMQGFTHTPILIAVYENKDNRPVEDSVYFFKIDDIIDNKQLKISSRYFGKCLQIPLSLTFQGFGFIEMIYHEFTHQNAMDTLPTIETKRQLYPNAYEKWTSEDDEKLELLYCEGKTIKELSELFGRNNGAIRSRINKLELKEKYDKI